MPVKWSSGYPLKGKRAELKTLCPKIDAFEARLKQRCVTSLGNLA